MIQITSLCDNVNNSKILWSTEGNSLLINAFGRIILFDTGRCASVLSHNLDCLGIKFDDISVVVLSHGHMGHIGAMRTCNEFKNAMFYYGSGLAIPKFKYKNNNFLPVKNEKLIESLKCLYPYTEVSSVFELVKQKIYLFKAERHLCVKPDSEKYYIQKENDYKQDYFEDEINLCIKTSKGLVLVSGCAHCGVDNLIQTATNIFDEKRIYAVIGGTHLFDDMKATGFYIDLMNKYNVSMVAPSHCTGILSRAHIAEALSDAFFMFTTGEIISLEE